MKKLLLYLVSIVSTASFGQSTITTTTNIANNGGGGATMFEVITTSPVFITGASCVFSTVATGPAEIWFKAGTIATNYPGSGNVSAAGGWTLALTGTATSTSNTTMAPISFGSTMIALNSGTYTFVVNGAGALGGTRYMTGTVGSTNQFTDGTLTIDNSIGRGGVIPSSMTNSPRYFVGSISYILHAACTGTPTAGTTLASSTSVCPLQNSTLTLGVPRLRRDWPTNGSLRPP